MKFKFTALAAALFCLASCVDVESGLGESLIPLDQTYKIYPTSMPIPAEALSARLADSLSGYSQNRITIGAIRDEAFGLTTRASALTLIANYKQLDFGNKAAAKIRGFHFAAQADTISVAQRGQEHILQNVRGYAVSEYIDPRTSYDCNNAAGNVKVDFGKSIIKGSPVINGSDSLSFDFTDEFARRFLDITQKDLDSVQVFTRHFPGIYLTTDAPAGNGGRINIFNLQLGYDSDYGTVMGNYAELKLTLDYDNDGKAEKDTSFFFIFGLTETMTVDSLLDNYTRGSYPEYALNITGHETRAKQGTPTDKIAIEGGGGLKPVVSALGIKHMAEKLISEKGGKPTEAVINKASLVFPFEFPDDYRDMYKFPVMLSPTCRMRSGSTVSFASLTDASSSDENQGDINRSTLRYSPDITYHVQELLKINETPVPGETETQKARREMLLSGQYDVWFIIMANEVTTTTNQSNNDMSDYYQYLAYQSYYNNMYGGYGGYGGYGYGGYGYGGYGGYGYDSYSNYYSYMLASMYASSNATTTSSETKLDKDRYYCAALNGPDYPDSSLRPTFELTFSLVDQMK